MAVDGPSNVRKRGSRPNETPMTHHPKEGRAEPEKRPQAAAPNETPAELHVDLLHVGTRPGEGRARERERPPRRAPAEAGRGARAREALLLLSCFLGIFVSYFVYGLLQEKIIKRKFGEEKFHYFLFLVGIQCVINAGIAKTVCWFRGIRHSLSPYRLFPVLSFTYVGAMVASNSALAFITYPTQVLGKSAKPILVLIFGVLFGHRHYPPSKYVVVLLIVAGVALFLYEDGGGGVVDTEDHWRLFHFIGVGELLVFLSLTFDGMTGAVQERLRSKFDVQALHMMYAAIYLSLGVLLSSEGVEVGGFIARHPTVLLNILAFGAASAIGQIFIFTAIVAFGTLTCSIFTTVRKFFTILGSVIIFRNALIQQQWVGVALVFLGLSLDIGISQLRCHGRHRSPSPKTSSI